MIDRPNLRVHWRALALGLVLLALAALAFLRWTLPVFVDLAASLLVIETVLMLVLQVDRRTLQPSTRSAASALFYATLALCAWKTNWGVVYEVCFGAGVAVSLATGIVESVRDREHSPRS